MKKFTKIALITALIMLITQEESFSGLPLRHS